MSIDPRQCLIPYLLSFFFNDTATTEIYTLSLHDALPISAGSKQANILLVDDQPGKLLTYQAILADVGAQDRKSTRLNSSHRCISYAVFCLKKKKHRYLTCEPPTRTTRRTPPHATPRRTQY